MPRGIPNKVKPVERVEPVAAAPEAAVVAAPADETAPTLIKATELLIERNGRFDFTAGGRPDLRKLGAIVGREVTTSERDAAWEQIMMDRQRAVS